MSAAESLHARFAQSAAAFPERIAVVDPSTDQQFTYAELDKAATAISVALVSAGVVPGDRVGMCAPKSIHAVASLLGILKADAAYVPVDTGSPPQRNTYIFSDCAVRCIIADEKSADALTAHGGFESRQRLSEHHLLLTGSQHTPPLLSAGLAYVLYTSGSTGSPKGVMLTHGNALSFVNWCIREFNPSPEDRFSSHAPFHFDLSILDLYVPLFSGATVVILNESLGKNPAALSKCIESQKITCWYSTPSILRLLVEIGKLDQRDLSSLRLVNFAGEVFPIKFLRALKEIAPQPIYYNLYGPTETNVCTYYRIPRTIPDNRTTPYPIGYCCDNDRARVVDLAGDDVGPGDEGELVVQGGTVMRGYWNLPERTSEAYFGTSDPWYRTGDVVREEIDGAGCYVYLGRRDRMIKRRGYRVELGEIEAAFHSYPGMREAAAMAVTDEQEGMLVRVFLVWDETEGKAPSTIKLKAYSARNLPTYMIPDRFVYLPKLPQTSTDKVDYQKLTTLA
ncbi:MAG: amino acid adenylation domain-containing protein [Verrucomicrobiales bacterium]